MCIRDSYFRKLEEKDTKDDTFNKRIVHYIKFYQFLNVQGYMKEIPLSLIHLSAKNGLIVITPDFDNFTAKLIAADEYSKYMTETPILELSLIHI